MGPRVRQRSRRARYAGNAGADAGPTWADRPFARDAGELVLEIEVDQGELVLSPVGTWSVEGGPIRSSWVYEATQHGPSGSFSRTLDGSRVAHIQYSFEPSRPWDGRGPLKASSTTVALAKMLELRLLQGSGRPCRDAAPRPERRRWTPGRHQRARG